jgi:AcrR family transcriptional regulator
MTVSAAEPGLRERKKAATRLALHTAAVRLAIGHGVDNVTVEAIADAAGVSRRTFSNYFANKEEALLHGDQERIRALVAMVRARPSGETAWVALSRAADEHYRELGELDQAWVAQGRLVRTQPGLIAAQAHAFAALERELQAAVAARIHHPDLVRAQLTAAIFLSTLRVSVQIWLEQPPGTVLLGDVVQRALAEAGRGLLSV